MGCSLHTLEKGDCVTSGNDFGMSETLVCLLNFVPERRVGCLKIFVFLTVMWISFGFEGRLLSQTFLTLDKAPREVFPEAESFEEQKILSTPQLRKEALKVIGRNPSIWEPFYFAYIAKRGTERLGYAIICEEIGRDRPITFITAVNLDGTIKDVAIMMYRETRGGEVHYPVFTDQFKGKSLQNPILGQGDIRNITGATLSVRALSTGVRKALAIVKLTMMKESETHD